MEKKTVELVVKGEIDINGITIKNIEGGFGEGLKCLTINDISEVLDIDIKEANRKINTYRDFFRDGIDIIDLKTGGDLSPVLEMGYTQAQIGNANNIYVLSERGYFKFIKTVNSEKAWQSYEKLLDEYFQFREENKEIKHYIKRNNRLTDKCLMNLDGQKEDEPDFIFLVNNTVRNEVERIIEIVGVKAGVIAIKSNIGESMFSLWRTRKTSFNFK